MEFENMTTSQTIDFKEYVKELRMEDERLSKIYKRKQLILDIIIYGLIVVSISTGFIVSSATIIKI